MEEDVSGEKSSIQEASKNTFREHRELNSRCALDQVRKLLEKFDKAKKEAIRSLGFSSWLDIRCGKIDHKLCLFILDKIKIPQFALELNSHSLLFMPEQVGYILGFRTSGSPVADEGELKDIEFLCEKHRFRGTETVTLGSLECALGAKDAEVDAGFKEKLVLFLLATVFCPMTSLNISMSYLYVIKDIDRVSEYNWALFVFNKLQDAVIEYKLHVVAGLHVLPLSRCPPIWLSVWTHQGVKLLQRHLKKQGGYNNAKLLGTNDNHPTKNEKEANKEEKKKSVVIDDEHHSTVIHNKDEGIVLEELKEDVKCMKASVDCPYLPRDRNHA
uniref:Aminotransferase-like plant mobile domain-containing protein n=1 Tax=Fagus sylvatica TaxID=28930 RepID=A0A2N9I7M0_FAGSY